MYFIESFVLVSISLIEHVSWLATLKRWRYEGIDPKYVEIEGRISYDIVVLLDYIKVNTRVPSVRAAMEDSRGTF